MKYLQHNDDPNLPDDARIQAPEDLEKLLNRKGYSFGPIGSNFYVYASDREWEKVPGWMSHPPHICLYKSGSWDGRAIPGQPDFIEGTDLVTYLDSLPDYPE
jgi:hypothetical protein